MFSTESVSQYQSGDDHIVSVVNFPQRFVGIHRHREGEPNRLDHLGQQLARSPDKGNPGPVFLSAGEMRDRVVEAVARWRARRREARLRRAEIEAERQADAGRGPDVILPRDPD